MIKTVKIDVDRTVARLDYWLDKVEDCYREEIRQSMNNFRREIGIKVASNEEECIYD